MHGGWPAFDTGKEGIFLGVAAAVAVIVLCVCAAVAVDRSGFLVWVEQHAGLAGWLQALGTILAIAATYWLSTRAERDNRLRKNDRARMVALRVATMLSETLHQVELAEAALPSSWDILDVSARDHHLVRLRTSVFFRYRVPDTFFLDFDALPRTSARSIAQVVFAIGNFDRRVVRLLNEIDRDAGLAKHHFDNIRTRLHGIRVDLGTASMSIANYLGDQD